MNYLMHLLRERLSATGFPLVEHDAVSTAYSRCRLRIAKSHVNDAACLGDPLEVRNVPERVALVSSVGHGRRQMLWPPDKHGSPRHKRRAMPVDPVPTAVTAACHATSRVL